jgi:hypothetical protein
MADVEALDAAAGAAWRLLVYANLQDGDLDERLRAMPLHRSADATMRLYELGSVTPADSDDGAWTQRVVFHLR